MIKTNNRQNSERHLWAINCVVEDPNTNLHSRGSKLLNGALTAAGRQSEFTIIAGAGHGQFDRKVTEDCFQLFERILIPARTAHDGDN